MRGLKCSDRHLDTHTALALRRTREGILRSALANSDGRRARPINDGARRRARPADGLTVPLNATAAKAFLRVLTGDSTWAYLRSRITSPGVSGEAMRILRLCEDVSGVVQRGQVRTRDPSPKASTFSFPLQGMNGVPGSMSFGDQIALSQAQLALQTAANL